MLQQPHSSLYSQITWVLVLAWLPCRASVDRCSRVPPAWLFILKQKLCQAVRGQSQWKAFPGQHLATWQGTLGIWQPPLNSGLLSCLECQSSPLQLTCGVVVGEQGTLSSFCMWSRAQGWFFILWFCFLFDLDPNMLYTNQIISLCVLWLFLNDLLLSFWIKVLCSIPQSYIRKKNIMGIKACSTLSKVAIETQTCHKLQGVYLLC